MLNQVLNITKIEQFKIAYINNQKFLISNFDKNLKYFKFTNEINIFKKKETLILSYPASSKITCELQIFKCFLWLKNLAIRKSRKLILKGLGLKVQVINKQLEFKLGFSHLVYLSIPENITITSFKNNLLLESFDAICLGNFANKIKSLKQPKKIRRNQILQK